MIDKTTGAPIDDPVIEIGGNKYSLRFSFIAQYEADRLKVNIREFIGGLQTANVGTLSTFVALFTAMVAHNFTALAQPVPSPDYWVGQLDRMTSDQRQSIFQRVAEVLASWLKERASAVLKLQEPAPPIQGQQPN